MAGISPEQFKDIHSRLGTDGGFTVNARTGKAITSGISVAPFGNERRVPVESSTPDVLAEYHAQNQSAGRFGGPEAVGTRFQGSASLGGWRSESDDFFDTPTVYKNTPAGNAAARRQMVHSRQEAGFNLDTFEEIPNPFHPEMRRKTGQEPHELADMALKDPKLAMQQPEIKAWTEMPRSRARGTTG